MTPEQQKLQEDLQTKQAELDALKSKVSLNQKLSEEEQNKQAELEKFITENTSKLQIQNTQIEVSTTIETSIDTRRTYNELIKGSAMEAKLKALNKTDAEIEQITLHIDAVVRKYYDKELAGFSPVIINGMCAGTQSAMVEALANSGNNSAELFAATADGLSDNGLNSLFGKITDLVSNVKNKASGLLGPLSGTGPLPTLAKRVQNVTAFVALHKAEMSDGAVPQLINPYKFKELLNSPTWDSPENFAKPETLALFTLHSTEGSQLSADEKKKLQDVVNNPQLKIDEKTITNMEKALNTTDKFLDKRSGWQQMFMGIFDKIKAPLSLFFGKGKNLLPSDILGHGLLATALGATSLDAYYLAKNVPSGQQILSTETQKPIPTITEEQLRSNISAELIRYNSPVTAAMVISSSKKFSVPVEYIMAFMKNDSHYGIGGVAAKTHNPGNVGNTDDGSTKDRGTRESGVDAVGSNLKARIDAYHLKVDKDKYPTVAELAKGVSDNGTRFFGVYMTAEKGPSIVATIQDDLVQDGIFNKDQLPLAA